MRRGTEVFDSENIEGFRTGVPAPSATPYPDGKKRRDAWVEALRPRLERPVPGLAQAKISLEIEPDGHGGLAHVVTLFLVGRECPWRCVMCDLWEHTFEQATPPGWILNQVQEALRRPMVSKWIESSDGECWVKLYNAGSFFDPRAVPVEERRSLAQEVSQFDRVIVECHPRLVGPRVAEFRDELVSSTQARSRVLGRSGQSRRERDRGPSRNILQVAMGLETVHPEVLPKLNKGFDLPDFDRSAHWLRERAIGQRIFLMVQPPFLRPCETRDWTLRSVRHAASMGGTTISLIPTRMGNGAMEALALKGEFVPPTLETLEKCFEDALNLGLGETTVLADTWNLDEFSHCAMCFEQRKSRVETMNRTQRTAGRVHCETCRSGEGPVGT